jgi:hypothetical protein
MLVMISMATDEMIGLVAMYPDVWFMDATSGKCVYFFVYEFNGALYFVSVRSLNCYLDIFFNEFIYSIQS